MYLLDTIIICITSEININRIGVYMKKIKCHDEYNIAKRISLLYTIQEGQEKRCNSIGDLVAKTTKLNPIASVVGWLTVRNIKKISKLIRSYMQT